MERSLSGGVRLRLREPFGDFVRAGLDQVRRPGGLLVEVTDRRALVADSERAPRRSGRWLAGSSARSIPQDSHVGRLSLTGAQRAPTVPSSMGTFIHAKRVGRTAPSAPGRDRVGAPRVEPGSLQAAINHRPQVQRVAQQREALQHGPWPTHLARMATQMQSAQAGPRPSGGPPVQRLVASASEGQTDDRVFQNTTLVAHTMVGGKIKRLSTIDFTKDFAGPGEGLAVTAHGNINKVGDYAGDAVAAKLVDPTTGLPDGTHDVFFQSCYAAVIGPPTQTGTAVSQTGAPVQTPPVITPTSVISTAKSALEKRAKQASWTRVPTVSGSAGPQIVVRSPKASGPGFDIDKTVVDPRQLKAAAAIQNVLVKVMEPVKTHVVVNFGHEGADFVNQAEQDEAKVNPLKRVFIDLIRGEPGKVDPTLLASLKMEWGAQQNDAALGNQIFGSGVDLRAPQETVTL